jgi:micrococcal nuclease
MVAETLRQSVALLFRDGHLTKKARMNLYTYRAEVESVYDGDTVTLTIDLGFGIVMRHQKCRLFGINAPELRDPGGVEARDFLRGLLSRKDKPLLIETVEDKTEKYGRWLVKLLVEDQCLNDIMVNKGHAIFRQYDYVLQRSNVTGSS